MSLFSQKKQLVDSKISSCIANLRCLAKGEKNISHELLSDFFYTKNISAIIGEDGSNIIEINEELVEKLKENIDALYNEKYLVIDAPKVCGMLLLGMHHKKNLRLEFRILGEMIYKSIIDMHTWNYETQAQIGSYKIDLLVKNNGGIMVEIDEDSHNDRIEKLEKLRENVILLTGYKLLRIPIKRSASEEEIQESINIAYSKLCALMYDNTSNFFKILKAALDNCEDKFLYGSINYYNKIYMESCLTVKYKDENCLAIDGIQYISFRRIIEEIDSQTMRELLISYYENDRSVSPQCIRTILCDYTKFMEERRDYKELEKKIKILEKNLSNKDKEIFLLQYSK